MNFKLNALIAAALLVAAGSANAKIDLGTTAGNANGGEIFLVVNDDVAGYSFVGDLGIGMDSFMPNTNQSFNLGNFSQWTPFLSAIGGNLSNATFSVLAQDNSGNTTGDDRMLVSTAPGVTEADIEFTSNGQFSGATQAMNPWLTSLNNNQYVVAGDMLTVDNGSAYSIKGSKTYFDANVGEKIKLKLNYSVYTGSSDAANFGLQMTSGPSNTPDPTIYTAYGDFTINGTTLAYTAAPVPEAETYGMMLAGLGLVAFMVKRRRGA